MRSSISRQFPKMKPLEGENTFTRFSLKTPVTVPASLLKGREQSLVHICPRFPKSIAPILFHLPERTISRILDSLPPHLTGPTFVCNGQTLFGLDADSVNSVLPRWTPNNDRLKAQKHMMDLSQLLCKRANYISEDLLSETIRVTGTLREADIIPDCMANEILRIFLPICLDRLALSRQDVFNIVYGLNRIRVTSDNAAVFPLIANFAHWYLGRSKFNRRKRLQATRLKNRIDTFISS